MVETNDYGSLYHSVARHLICSGTYQVTGHNHECNHLDIQPHMWHFSSLHYSQLWFRLNFTCNLNCACMMSHTHIHLSLLIHRLAEAGHRVVGVDISEIAVKGFFIDNHLPYEKKRIGKLMRYRVSLCNTNSPQHAIHARPPHTLSSPPACYFSSPLSSINHEPPKRNFSLLFTRPPFSLLCACPCMECSSFFLICLLPML